jgi:hypothetical protein
MAHYLARLVYRMLRYGQNYVEQGIHQYELKSSHSASNGSEKKPNHSTFNSFPLSNFHHQFLERERPLNSFQNSFAVGLRLDGRRRFWLYPSGVQLYLLSENFSTTRASREENLALTDHRSALLRVMEILSKKGRFDCKAIGHRVAHGGEYFREPELRKVPNPQVRIPRH